MLDFLNGTLIQLLPFLPLAFGIAISYNVLRATDMTLDGSFVLGAAVFARLTTLGISPGLASLAALISGTFAGMLTALIQRGGRVDSLLAGILATFILSSINLVIMNKPNISLLNRPTLLSEAFQTKEIYVMFAALTCAAALCLPVFLLLKTRFGLNLRAFGDNPLLFRRLGKPIELYRLSGFALTNALAGGAGCLTAQMAGFADTGMGFGMTLTGIGAIILGHQILQRISNRSYFRVGMEFMACLIGIFLYFCSLNFLLRTQIDPIYLKMILGILLACFLRAAIEHKTARNSL